MEDMEIKDLKERLKNDINNINGLITDYREEYKKDKHPFLLYELAHVKENDHTRVLKSILCFDNKFLYSFLERIGVRYNQESPEVDYITDQEKAVGNKGTGFVDLFIKIGDEKVIIENKICGAPDGERQLARYIATACGVKDNKEFEKIWNFWKDGSDAGEIIDEEQKLSNIHVIYLTADGNKTPGVNSLPKYFRNEDDSDAPEYKYINYYPVNYAYDIIPWLEDDVLPNVPFLDDGIMIAGIRQYIASLKDRYIPLKSSECVKKFVDNLKINPLEKYLKIKDVIDYLNLNDVIEKLDPIDNQNIGKIQGELSERMKFLFPDPSGWKLYFTSSFILMYKEEWWSENDKKKNYNFPAIHLFCSPTDNLIRKKNKISWCIKGTRIPSSYKIKDASYIAGWRLIGGDIVKALGDKVEASKCNDDYFKTFVENMEKNQDIKDTLKMITDLISEAKANNIPYQVALIERVKGK